MVVSDREKLQIEKLRAGMGGRRRKWVVADRSDRCQLEDGGRWIGQGMNLSFMGSALSARGSQVVVTHSKLAFPSSYTTSDYPCAFFIRRKA